MVGWLRAVILSVLAAASFLAAAVWLLDLRPPHQIVFAAGRQGGAYHVLAERYRQVLARDGIHMEILDTAGSVENAARLAAGTADAGFLQGGVDPPPEAGIEALAATFLEPLWIFRTGGIADHADLARWHGLRIAAGEPGGGTRFVVDAVLAALDINPHSNTLLPLGGAAAADALRAGDVDVALFVGPVGTPYLRELFTAPGVTLSAIHHSDALIRRLRFAQTTDIPPAGFDYASSIPPRRIELVAMTGRLAVRPNLHPALIDRLVNAARQVHDGRDLVTRERAFPTTTGAAMPVNAQAEALLAGPPSALYRFLPYWVVAQINSFALLLVPIVVILFPLLRTIPGLYQWRMRSRVYRHYLDLLEIDRHVMAGGDAATLQHLEERLAAIETDLVGLHLPLSYREHAYTMRVHIDLVRRRINNKRRAAVASSVDPGSS